MSPSYHPHQAAQLEERRYELHWQQWQLVEDEQPSPAVWQRFERPCFDPEGRNSTPSLRERATEAGGSSGALSGAPGPWQPQPWQQRPGGGAAAAVARRLGRERPHARPQLAGALAQRAPRLRALPDPRARVVGRRLA